MGQKDPSAMGDSHARERTVAGARSYSRLAFLLQERGLTADELYRHVRDLHEPIDLRTIQRLADPDRPLRHVDMRIMDALCRALEVEIGELLVFAPALAVTLRRLPEDRLRRLSALMDAHADRELDPGELRELETLVAEADEIDFANAQRLVEHRDRVREAGQSRAPSAAD